MQAAPLQCPPQTSRPAFVVLLVLLVIVVVCALIWLDPSALFNRSDPELPWNEEFRIVKSDKDVPPPSEQQPQLTSFLEYNAEAQQQGKPRGQIGLLIHPDGRIKGGWGGEYKPQPEVTHEIFAGQFKGNIDPSKIYHDADGEDPTKLYFITKGRFLILETNWENNKVRKVAGRIYVTGWLDTEYNAAGKITITSDKRSFETFSWRGKGTERKMIFDFFEGAEQKTIFDFIK